MGVHGGGSWSTAVSPVGTTDANGGLLGVHAGYNFQYGSIVYGIEADVGYNWNDTVVFPGLLTAGTDWHGSLRGRLGYAFDRSLLYATGGVAFTGAYANIIPTPALSTRYGYTGWTIGAGFEHAFTESVTVRPEYRYTDFGSQAALLGPTSLREHRATLGISYKF